MDVTALAPLQTQMAMAGATIQAPCHVSKSLHLIQDWIYADAWANHIVINGTRTRTYGVVFYFEPLEAGNTQLHVRCSPE